MEKNNAKRGATRTLIIYVGFEVIGCIFFWYLAFATSGTSQALGIVMGIGLVASIIATIKDREKLIKNNIYYNENKTEIKRKQEEEKKVNQLEQMYKYGKIDAMTYDLNRAKMTGTKNAFELYGYNAGNALYKKMDTEKALEEHNRTADKKVIYSGAIGGAIGGIGGTIIGASSAASHVAQEGAALQQQAAEADAKWKEALKNS